MESGDQAATSPLTLLGRFQSLAAEGDLLLQRSSYLSAIHAYTLALELQPASPACLIARSRCYVLIGQPAKALGDAMKAMDVGGGSRGLWMKAEAMYAQGDFELALLNFHRGHALRPELPQVCLLTPALHRTESLRIVPCRCA